MWGVHVTITTRTEKFLLNKAYELDIGFLYWIVLVFELYL